MSSVRDIPSRMSSFAVQAEHEVTARATQLVNEFRDHVKRGVPYSGDLGAIAGVVDALRNPDGIDDRKLLLEHVLVFLSQHSNSELGQKLSTATVELLYNDLPHPPETYIGDKYAWRTADGSGNNVALPDLGKAGTPYARSVQQTHPLPRSELPDAGLVFDTLLRREQFVKHPAGLSSMMFSFAALVIHTVFRTKHSDVTINETSSYVDLAPLYGHNQESMDKIRVRDGRGLLQPDTFAEDRLLLLPPAVCVLLVLFSRNHNYIAKMLLQINERGAWHDPDSISSHDAERSAKLLKQEEEIFQTARLINCAWFASVVFSDYFSAILGLVRQGNSWSLNPFGEIRDMDHGLFERGRGNVCSVEFNCLYRWHATTSVEDEKWIEQLFGQLFPDKTWDQVTIPDFKDAIKKMKAVEVDASHWTFGSLKRQEDGTFMDAELAAVLKNATEHPASAFKARGTPHVMRLHEIMGIESNRQWGVCSLNDFRKFLGLKPYTNFLEWNPDPTVATTAEKLYGTIDRLELYVGLQAEAAKPVVEGAGLCPGYTISRAILSDAIALTRGDRFFTADYTPFNMTSWGFADCQRQPDAPGYGSTLGRLFLRTLPEQFGEDSAYAWFPLMTPDAMRKVLADLGDAGKYAMNRPGSAPKVPEVKAYADVAAVLGNEAFVPMVSSRASKVISGDGFFIASSNPSRATREQRAIVGALTVDGGMNKICGFLHEKTREQMLQHSYSGVGSRTKSVDVVRDVLKYTPVHWAAYLAGIKLKETPTAEGAYTPAELFDVLSEIYTFLFLDVQPGHLMKLEERVKAHISKLQQQIVSGSGGSRLSIFGLVESLSALFFSPEKDERAWLAERLQGLGFDAATLGNVVLAVIVGASVEMSQAIINVVNFYLEPAKTTNVAALSTKNKLTANDESVFAGLVNEALRIDPPFRGVYREAVGNHALRSHSVKTNECVFVNIADANMDPHVFQDPASVNPSRQQSRHLVGDGSARCLGAELSGKMIASVVRAVFSFPNMRRAPGQSGILKRFKEDSLRTSAWSYLSVEEQTCVPWANSMVVQFE